MINTLIDGLAYLIQLLTMLIQCMLKLVSLCIEPAQEFLALGIQTVIQMIHPTVQALNIILKILL